jgi:energy-coupling factor transporter ATP-binding protein EcfA2
VRAGEVVGIAGVSGNGQRELLYALSGEDTRAAPADPGRRQAGPLRPGARRQLGAALRARGAPGPRRRAVAVAGAQPAAHAHRRGRPQRLDPSRRCSSRRRTSSKRFNVKAGGPHAAARSLSGGNLQKFIVGREIDAKPKLLIVSQPTWGVDVGAAAQIRGEILALRDAGCAVLVVSEELDELFEMCDRLHVIAKGRLSPSLAAQRGHGREDRRVDERPVGARCASMRAPSPQPSPRGEAGGACLSSRRPSVRFWSIASPLLALVITVAIGTLLFVALGKDPVRGLQVFFWEPIKLGYALGELMVKATPLLLIALGLAVCFRSNVWNIGAEGQFVIGAIAAGGVALLAGKDTGRWIVVAILLAGVAAAWPGRRSPPSCATASTPTRSWSA